MSESSDDAGQRKLRKQQTQEDQTESSHCDAEPEKLKQTLTDKNGDSKQQPASKDQQLSSDGSGNSQQKYLEPHLAMPKEQTDISPEVGDVDSKSEPDQNLNKAVHQPLLKKCDDPSELRQNKNSDSNQQSASKDDQNLSSKGVYDEQHHQLKTYLSSASPTVEGLESCAKLLAENRLSYDQWLEVLQSLCNGLTSNMARELKRTLDATICNEQVGYVQCGHAVRNNSIKVDAEHSQIQPETEKVTSWTDIKKDVDTSNIGKLSRCKRSNCCTMIFCKLSLFASILAVALALCVPLFTERNSLGTFSFTNFFAKNLESADLWEKLDRRSIHILVTGKTGTGKSALINGLMGANITKEGDTLDPTTAQVEQIKQMVHGVSMSVFDSPGLQDGTRREDEYLRDMELKCKNVDLVLYTIKLTDQRVHVADTDAMRKLTDAFGDRFWERAMFVMTFANEVLSPEYPEDEEENQKYFESRLKLWKEKLPKIVEERADIPLEIARHIPIVPAGYYKTRDLPGRKYWFSKLWMAALNRIMETSAERAGYMLEFTQDRLKNYDDMTEEDFKKPIHEQPILKKLVDE